MANSGDDFSVVTLIWGDKYDERYVTALREAVSPRTLHVLRDEDFPNVPLQGWYWKLYLFSSEVQERFGDILWLDLDTVLMGDLDWVSGVERFMCLRSAWYKDEWGSGVMYIPKGTGHKLWDITKNNPEIIQQYRGPRIRFGDQGVIRQAHEMGLIENSDLYESMLQRKFPGRLRSYKNEIVKEGVDPYTASIIFFHGEPKPHQVNEPWIPEVLRA